MEARKCDVCGGFFLPYIASNKIGGKSDSYNEIIVKEKRMGLKNANRYQEYDVWKDDDINISGVSVRKIWEEGADGRCRCTRKCFRNYGGI